MWDMLFSVLSVKWAYYCYEIYMRGRFDLEFGNGIWILIYDGRCSMFGTMFLGVGSPLLLVVVDGIKCEDRGSDVHLLHVVLTLSRSYHLHFALHSFDYSG
jgi:hypothetical protein